VILRSDADLKSAPADQAEQVSTTGLVDAKQQPSPTKRRQYPEALKRRQMVAETQVPGASVSIVARRHDVNSNQLFRWRRQLLPKAAVESGAMVPFAIAPDGDRPRRTDREGIIEIAFGRVHGCAFVARSAPRHCGR
jgi:transposase-like protein